MEWLAYVLLIGFWVLAALLVVCAMLYIYMCWLGYKEDHDSLIEKVCDKVLERLVEIESENPESGENNS